MEQPNPAAKDQRLFERFPARFPAKIKDTDSEFGSSILLRNASLTGIKINSREKMYVDDKVALEIELPERGNSMTFKGEVSWVKEDLNDSWEIGVKLLSPNFMQSARLYKYIVTDFTV